MKRKHKLLIITPSAEEIKLGFLSPSRNGFILGTPSVVGENTSHLTIISRKGTLSSHITPQERPHNKRYFPQVNLKDYVNTLREIVEQSLAAPLSSDQLSEEVGYVTQKFLDWLESAKNTLYERRTSRKEIIHVLNFKKLLGKLPQLVEELTSSPPTFFGLCKAKEILEDDSKIFGITDSRLFVIPFKNQLYHLDFSFITNFRPILEQGELSSPLSEIYRSMGLYQYMQEVEKKKIVERLLSKD